MHVFWSPNLALDWIHNASRVYPLYFSLVVTSLIALALYYVIFCAFGERPIYLLKFAVYEPPAKYAGDTALFKERLKQFPYTPESLQFMYKLVERNGLGPRTFGSPAFFDVPPSLTISSARFEAECTMLGSVDALFANTKVRPQDVDVLITNCSLFNPVPSLSAMIVNRYKLPENINSFHLGGMGCSSSMIAVKLAQDLLQLKKYRLALIVSTENITLNWYKGQEKSMLVTNTLFRLGGSAVLLSNQNQYKDLNAQYELLHVVRTHLGADDEAYRCVYQDIDKDGQVGVRLDKSLMKVAAKALTRNITVLAPLILPFSEKVKYVYHLVKQSLRKKWHGKKKAVTVSPSLPSTSSSSSSSSSSSTSSSSSNSSSSCLLPTNSAVVMQPQPPSAVTTDTLKANTQNEDDKKKKEAMDVKCQQQQPTEQQQQPQQQKEAVIDTKDKRVVIQEDKNEKEMYVPNFRKAVQHFCIHAGGKAVIDSIQKCLSLTDQDVKASRDVLFDRGNVSSASVWYELSYLEKQGIKRGDKIWQIAFGSGFKCNSGVWKKL